MMPKRKVRPLPRLYASRRSRAASGLERIAELALDLVCEGLTPAHRLEVIRLTLRALAAAHAKQGTPLPPHIVALSEKYDVA